MEDVQKTPEIPQVNPWIIVISVMFATFMEVLDTTVVNVSLPHIAGNLFTLSHGSRSSIDSAQSTWCNLLHVDNSVVGAGGVAAVDHCPARQDHRETRN